MSLAGRIRNIIFGIVMIALGVLLILDPKIGYLIVAVILGVALAVYGIRNIIFYFTMARHMVSGKLVLYFGVLVLDGGALILAVFDEPTIYIMIYLILICLVSGTISILRALEQKNMEVPAWKGMLISGIIRILVAITCAVFIKSPDVAVYIFAAELFYSALTRIITAIRPPKAITIL